MMSPSPVLDLPDVPVTLSGAFERCWQVPAIRALPALTDGTRELSYAQLDDQTARLAAQWQTRRAAPGAVVAILAGRSLDAVLALLGAIRAGLCPCVIEPGLPAAEVDERLALAGARWLAVDADHRRLGAQLARSALTPVDIGEPPAAQAGRPVAATGPGTRALLLFTSGSTGRPKAVELTQRAVLNNALGVISHSDLSAADRLLHIMPIYHTNGVNNQLFAPLLAGATVVFAGRFRADEMPALLERHRPTIITGVPTMYSRMLAQQFAPAALASLRMARCGSAPITEELHRQVEAKLGCPLVVSYGLSEATCTSTMNPPGARRIGSVGTVLAGQDVRVCPGAGVLTTEPGVEGEICIAGASLMSGYLGAADATSRAVTDGWLRTGDLGRFDEDGYLYITGRIKDVIIRGGENLSPLLIEGTITTDQRVAGCCVVGAPDKDLGEVPVAFVVRQPGSQLSEEDIKRCVREHLSRIYVPQLVHFVDALPETAVGKLDRKALAARARLDAPERA
jgi:acyl-CoA synthetase (AMP-forming)/AMP-acid ligase II